MTNLKCYDINKDKKINRNSDRYKHLNIVKKLSAKNYNKIQWKHNKNILTQHTSHWNIN